MWTGSVDETMDVVYCGFPRSRDAEKGSTVLQHLEHGRQAALVWYKLAGFECETLLTSACLIRAKPLVGTACPQPLSRKHTAIEGQWQTLDMMEVRIELPWLVGNTRRREVGKQSNQL